MSILCYSSILAATPNQLIFFGDSLSDNGNYYSISLKLIPPSPPYYKGRFSNGFTWAENLGNVFYQKYYIDYRIYAVGGATATPIFIAPTTLRAEIYDYLTRSLLVDRSKTLFSVWIGANDYLFDSKTDVDTLSSHVINRIAEGINLLIEHGGKHFIVMNLPDIAKTPYGQHGATERLHTLSILHNQKLAAAINQIENEHPEVKIVFIDIYQIFAGLLKDPQQYNTKYHVNITNTTDACWNGLGVSHLSTANLNQELKAAYLQTNKMDEKFDGSRMTNSILSAPGLAESYAVGKTYQTHVQPCTNADQYIFWDAVHPTAIMHTILAKIVLENLT